MATHKHNRHKHNRHNNPRASYDAVLRAHTRNRAARGENVLGNILTSEPYRRDQATPATPATPATLHPPSACPADKPGAVGIKPTYTHYTGNGLLGLATLHKSNTVPITTAEQAIDAAHMRRN